MNDSKATDLVVQLRQFAAERDWEQFHNPKNLAMALVVEAVELVRELQPLIDGASTSTLRVKFYMLSAILFGTLGQEDEMKKSRDICAADLPHARGTVNRYIKWFNDLFGEDVTPIQIW